MSSDVRVDVLKQGSRFDSFVEGVKVIEGFCSAVVLIRGGGHNIIIDPGSGGYENEIIKKLKTLGVKPEDVDIIVNTHSHIDHIYNNYVFKGARIYTPSSIWYRDGDDRAEIYGDITKVEIPVVELINTPGHMENHISVVVKSKGKTFVVAGDAVRESIIKSGYAPKVYSHPQTYIKSLKKIFAIADVIIPGHGPTIDGKRLAELKEKVAKIKVEGED